MDPEDQDIEPSQNLSDLAPQEQAFFLAICRDNCLPPGIQTEHVWIERTERGLLKLSPAGENRLHELGSTYPQAVLEGMNAARAHWRGHGLSALASLSQPSRRVRPTLH